MPQIETNTTKVKRRLESEGWIDVGGKKHDKYKKGGVGPAIIVPRHRTLSPGVAENIARAAGWI
jgi:predicted RNA binding protein YcfA (HicA-like mRNA interferase family)